MAKQNYTAEQTIVKLREVEVLCSQGKSVGNAVRGIGMSEQAYYRWRKKYGGMSAEDAKRLRKLKKENSGLKKLAAHGRDRRTLRVVYPAGLSPVHLQRQLQ